MSKDDYQEQIVKYFSNRAKREADFCWVDREAIACWKEHNIPLKLVLEGIDSAFMAVAELKKLDIKITSLYQCHRYVLESWFEQKLAKYRQAEKLDAASMLSTAKLNEYIDRAINIFNAARFKAEQKRNFKLIDLLDKNYKSLISIKEIFLHSQTLGIEDFKLAIQEIEWDLEVNISKTAEPRELEKLKGKMMAGLNLSVEELNREENVDQLNKLISRELKRLYNLHPFTNLLN